MNFLAVDPPPGVDPFVGWVIAGLATGLCAVAVVAFRVVTKMADRALEREVAMATALQRSAEVIAESTHAVERINEFLEK